ncbi:MAG: succinylglutamate desuccinylase/aspartoacylase family protein [Cetobacterium sp.]|uniref:succinylglutamate desuccinylase/aspartoacylase family protein n=1 Tax=uncultured Cetobacterium sp. TaxID=527638 RepID=UPI0025FB7D69|nr:succinylglutamate desuccinylase/aspartoacylase family protein [uncultured Cetobacterium sp.]
MSKTLLLTFLSLSAFTLAKTEYTGGKYLGRDIITNLDVTDLEVGKTHEFFFQGTENSLGSPWYIPVTVIKGEKTGGKFLVNSGVHGNELNPILATYKVKEKLNPKNVKGTVTIVHGMNIPGLLNNTRGYKFGGNSENTSDLNRQMDSGKVTTVDQKYSTLIWQNLLSKNADKVIDLHTSGKGSQFPLFVYADFRNLDIKKMAELTGSDIVKMDNGEKGSVETSFVELGVPSITFELGSSETQEAEIVARATDGVLNNLIYWNYLDAKEIKSKVETFYGNTWSRIRAEKGGFVEAKVKVMDKVNKDDVLFVQYDAFGNVVKEYKSPNTGIVASVKDYPYSEPGDSLGRVIEYDKNDKDQLLK